MELSCKYCKFYLDYGGVGFCSLHKLFVRGYENTCRQFELNRKVLEREGGLCRNCKYYDLPKLLCTRKNEKKEPKDSCPEWREKDEA